MGSPVLPVHGSPGLKEILVFFYFLNNNIIVLDITTQEKLHIFRNSY